MSNIQLMEGIPVKFWVYLTICVKMGLLVEVLTLRALTLVTNPPLPSRVMGGSAGAYLINKARK